MVIELLFISVESPQLVDPVENDTSQNSGIDNGVMIIAILAVLLAVVSVICIILLIFVFKLKMQRQANDNKNR